ncbi:MAG: methyltransferase domain-containing protein [Chloroflexi bacterium]|nr:methyltransferase domain-containing protein [Chloroflexota bacterium]
MTHEDHLRLLHGGVGNTGGTWADFGSGEGAFTLALADLLGPKGEIYSVDRAGKALREQEKEMRARFPQVKMHYLQADFTRPVELPALDGIVMANSLHFVRHKEPVLKFVRSYLRPSGHLVLVEYNADRGNIWVPYPLSFHTWQTLALRSGFEETKQISAVPSWFLGEIYSAVSVQP